MDRKSDCHVEVFEKPEGGKTPSELSQAVLMVSGMGCDTCATRVRNAILRLDGVVQVDINLEQGLAKVAYDKTMVAPSAFSLAVAAAGNDGRHEYRAMLAA